MALMACDYCHRAPKGKLIPLIWARHGENGRKAYKTRSCTQDLHEALVAFGEPLPEEGDYIQLPTGCALCGDPLTPGELSVVYLTWYEGDGKHTAIFATCGRDSDERWHAISEIGELLPDRGAQNGRWGPHRAA